MKMTKILSLCTLVLLFFVVSHAASARDLTYKIGFGYQQLSTNGFVANNGNLGTSTQLNGFTAAYGVAKDLVVDATFSFNADFNNFIVGPAIRYDFQRLFSRNPAAWNHLNIFAKAGFFVKGGDGVETGVVLHAPNLGFEVLPFESNNFAITTQAGLVIDFVKETMFGFTNGMFGDVGVRFYF